MKLRSLLLPAAAFLCGISAHAGTIIYANSAGNDGIQIFDVDVAAGTETLIDSFGINVGNGRGVVVVGDTLYYTDASSGSVSSYTLSSHTDNGALFTVAGASGLATMAFDGTDFYLGDYSGTDNVYHYSLAGTLLGTVQLSECGVAHQGGLPGFCDGLEYANGHLVSNEGDGGFGGASKYDVYNLAGGTPSTAGLISSDFGLTGIAFDGTYYFTSDIDHDRLAIYDSTGAFVKNIALADGHHTFAIEDLSADYKIVLGGGVPEPSTIFLVLPALGLIAIRLRKRAGVPQV